MKPILWITDPWSTLDHERDTTLRLVREGFKRKVPQFWADFTAIRLQDQKVFIRAAQVLSVDGGMRLGTPRDFSPSHFLQVHYRTDPPVDEHYRTPLSLLLSAQVKGKPEIINPPALLLNVSEKFQLGLPKAWIPETLVSADRFFLFAFLQKRGIAIAKPTHQAQSKGVEKLEWNPKDSQNIEDKLSALTSEFRIPIVLQEFLPAITNGETRVWFLDGKTLAAIKKFPVSGDFRVLIDQGSHLEKVTLTPAQVKRCAAVGQLLRKLKIRLAAVDFIELKITDLNFTSPGLLVQMEQLLGRNLAEPIWKALLKK
jgi:glutathione synthase